MKKRRVIIFGVLAALGIAYFISLLPNFRHRLELKKTVRALQSLPRDRVDKALQEFARDEKAKGTTVPATVSLRQLVAGGYLRAENVAGFRERDVTLTIGVDETRPQQILVRVSLPSGGVVVELGDGSVQMLAR